MTEQKQKKKKKGGFLKRLFSSKRQEPGVEEGKTSKPKLTEKQLNQELLQAVIDNNVDKAKTYLELGGDVNYKFESNAIIKGRWISEGSSLLIIAATLGDRGSREPLCRLLLDAGADINAKDGNKRTVLMWAAKWRYTDICKILIEKGVDVNAKDNVSQTALLFATGHGFTNLENETHPGHIKLIEYLLSKGANPFIKSAFGTAYELAVRDREASKILRRYMDLWILFGEENAQRFITELSIAIAICSPEKVKEMIENL